MWRKRAGSIKKGIFAGIILLSGILFFPIGGRAVCVHYETAKTALYTESYHRIAMDFVQGSPLEAETEDGVDPSNGKLTLLREDLHMQGMAGMDFSLTRYYDSKKANIGKAIAEEKKDFEMDTVRIAFPVSGNKKHEIVVNTAIYKKHANALKDMFVSYEKSGDGKYTTEAETQQTKLISGNPYNVYGISTGWAFDFPWIETKTIGSDTDEIPTYLHYGSLGTMRIATDNKNAITGFENYAYQDIKLEDFNQTTDGVACRYLLRDKRGLRTYFNSDGVVVMQKDNHDNTIRFTYRNKIYFDTITDSVGRKVKFSYKESQHGLLLLQNVKVEGQKVAGGVSKKTITYNSSETSYRSIRGDQLYGSRLNSAVVEGTKETYTYQTVESLVNTAGAGVASQRAMTNESYLIQGAEEEGCIHRYEYRAGAIRSASSDANQERDVVTQHYYVTREYDQSRKNAKKKANGFKYDYFQKQTDRKNNTNLVSYEDLDDEKHEMQTYGTDKLQCMTLVSTYNPNKKQKAKKFTDYVYTKEDINISTLQLKKKPKRNTNLYVYNTNRLLLEETSEEKTKTMIQYIYDQSGVGSLTIYKIEKAYGSKRNGKVRISKEGYTYDKYRNLLTEKSPKAFKDKYKGKEKLFTITYTYHGNGYPEKDTLYILDQRKTEETYVNANIRSKSEYVLSADKMDVIKVCGYINENDSGYRLISWSERKYDQKGNEIEWKVYPSCARGEMGDVITYVFYYNALGQNTKTMVNKTSAKHPEQNKVYIEKESSYDSFGNEVGNKDRKGVVSTYTYDQDTSEEVSSVYAKGSMYEITDKTFHTEDNLKTMTLDNYDRCLVNQTDAFGNTVIEKDEKNGIWTENVYEYGDENHESTAEETDEGRNLGVSVTEPRLVEERTYAFEPTEEKVIIGKDGTREYNYDITGKGKEILSGSRHTYNEDNEEIVTAQFSGGAMDSSHCRSWTMNKSEEEMDDEENTIITSCTKELNPKKYTDHVDKENYYEQYNDYLLTEAITITVIDDEGNEVSEIHTITGSDNKQIIKTTSVYDDFGKVLTKKVTNQVSENGKEKNQSETVTSYEYDYQGNVIKKTVKSRRDTADPWVTTVTKSVYNDEGQLVASYDARGAKEGYATKYEYDISGQQIKVNIPVERKDGIVIYQINTKEYDEDGNVIAEEIEKEDGTVKRTEYVYDIANRLTLVKDVESDGKAIYAQYLYDREGNKIRQYSGMTKPLTLVLEEGKGNNSYRYMNKDYHIEVSGQAKKDVISETKYVYNKKNELTTYTDPEGNVESYSYDVYGNLEKIVDRNGNVIKQKYDYQNRLEKETAIEKETEKRTTRAYAYDDQGNISRIDNRKFTYDAITGQILSETKQAGKKTLKKIYNYDSDGLRTDFKVKLGDETVLSYHYWYDGGFRLQKVIQTDGSKSETIATYEYDVNGMLLKEKGEKIETDYFYNLNQTMSRMVNRTNDGVLLSQYYATYNKDRQKTEEKGEVRGIDGIIKRENAKYSYDMLGRLIKESHTGKEDISYTYDAHNNRKEMKTKSQTVSYKYNKNDELHRINTLNNKTGKVDVALYKYDKNGNQLATIYRKKVDKVKGDAQFDLNITIGQNQLNRNVVSHYNVINEQEEVLTKNYKVSYTYNAEGLRESKKVNARKSIYVWDGDQLVMELNKNGNVTKRYVRGKNLSYTDSGKDSKRQYYVMDIHGSVVQLLNENSNITKQYTYDAFGNEENPDKKDDNPFRYSGEYYDKETSMLYLRARSYDAGVGRFITADTYTGEENSISTLNLYTYCENDAVNMVDPSGHWGRKNGRFVHQDITKEAIQKDMEGQIGPGICCKVRKGTTNYKNLLDGSILPDFVNALCKKSKNKKDKKKKLTKVKNMYTVKYYNNYKKYKNKKLFDYMLKKEDNMFHGKSLKLLTDLKNSVKPKLRGKKYKKSIKYLMLGCVLHSIQDYSAHSYVSDLVDYKRDIDVYKNSKFKVLFAEENAYHSDWSSGKRDAEEHAKYKDNPNAMLVIVGVDGEGNPVYGWDSHRAREENDRYVQARRDTLEYLREVLLYIK